MTTVQEQLGQAVTRRSAYRSTSSWWLWALIGLNAMWVTDLFVLGGGIGNLAAAGDLLTAIGRITGLYGALMLVVQLALIARIPWLESSLGMDKLTQWHRWTGFGVLWLLLAHVVFITLGYASQDASPVLSEIGTLLFDTQDVLKAAVAMVLIIVVAATSVRMARRQMKYATWHFVHLYTYLAVVLGFLHQVTVGRDFVGSPIGRLYWWSLYGTALAAVLGFRVLVPLWRNLKHRLRVEAVVQEAHNVVSIHIGGRDLDALNARAGQFFLWRFLTKDHWWKAHPYSLSAMPDGRTLRITVKGLGDSSKALRRIRPGTRVLAEGPYGAFTTDKRTKHGVLLIGGGVGITPIRSLLEELATTGADVVVLYRVSDHRDAVLVNELQWLVSRCSARLHIVSGPSNATGRYGPIMGPQYLVALVPDIRRRDVFLCGPPGLIKSVLHALHIVGVPPASCHTERFAFAA